MEEEHKRVAAAAAAESNVSLTVTLSANEVLLRTGVWPRCLHRDVMETDIW